MRPRRGLRGSHGLFWLKFAGVFLDLAMTDRLLPIDKWRAFKTVFAHTIARGGRTPPFRTTVRLPRPWKQHATSLGLLKITDAEHGTSHATRLEAVMIRLAALAARPANGRISREQELRLFDLVTAICAPLSTYGKNAIEVKAGTRGRQAKPGRLRSEDDSRLAVPKPNRAPAVRPGVAQPDETTAVPATTLCQDNRGAPVGRSGRRPHHKSVKIGGPTTPAAALVGRYRMK